MRPVVKFSVAPVLPKNIERIKELAYNYWWSWNQECEELFARIDKEIWEEVNHNPVMLLSRLPQEHLNSIAVRSEFTSYLDYVYERYSNYMNAKTWHSSISEEPGTIAYFCAEFGLNESFMNYSGGLGVLAGDHLKSASDLGLPLVAVGLLYQQGYFHQYLTQNGWQSERYTEADFSLMPLTLMKDESGLPLLVDVDLPLGKTYAQIWKVQVGRVPLYLLDTNIQQNAEILEYRDITDQLYGGNTDTRIMQEIILGIGGMRALKLLGIEPSVIHINEGHAAFCTLERTRMYMEKYSMDFATAKEMTTIGSCFTTHTPVPAGNEIFTLTLIDKYFGSYAKLLGLTMAEFLDLARHPDDTIGEGFSMTILGLRMCAFRNGVSLLHSKVSQKMWQHVWDKAPLDEVPIRGITNGVHSLTWVAKEMAEMYDRYLGPQWRTETDDAAIWQKVETIPNEELWRIHQRRRERLVLYTRNHLRRKQNSHITQETLSRINDCLDPDALTIGLARRFATYKRTSLLFSDMERLSTILNNPTKPVQIIVAGKAHPRDTAGKEMMQYIIEKIKTYNLERKIVFLEDYDMGVARFLVKGADIWLNTPRRPYEASGTSGMKAALNGCLHFSILDGWWAEAYNGENGFAIGRGEDYEDNVEQDMIERETLYSVLENVVVPMFYERGTNKTPDKWVQKMKNSIITNAGEYSTTRMVRDYYKLFYSKALAQFNGMKQSKGEDARDLLFWKRNVTAQWDDISVGSVSVDGASEAYVGKRIHASASVKLGNISPDSITVELYYGTVDSHDNITHPRKTVLDKIQSEGDTHYYEGEYICEESGMQGATVRVLPKHKHIVNPIDMNLCVWA